MGILSAVFGDLNSRELKKIEKIANEVESYQDAMAALSDEALKAKTPEFKERLRKGETLDDILPEAFAVCREAAWRVLKMKHFHVQIIGGIVLHQGNIAEMKTGEGKTLVATLPVYLNALEGKGVHVVTVNDYLAQRDAEWMGQVYRWLGLTVGCVIHDVESADRKAAYEADITYGTNNEFGFDYLRDNMAIYAEQQMQRELNFAIVDEVDSILIDEARTPLIISGQGDKSNDLYYTADRFVRTLVRGEHVKEGDPRFGGVDYTTGDYTVDEKDKTCALTEEGIAKCERYFRIDNFSDPENMDINHHVNIALKAHAIMKRDIDYIENDGEIVIVDEFTGRLMFGRRYSDGLHQAIEAKEGIKVRNESKTLATITLQNYFRMYKKLAGMTGTAKTEEEEFNEIYNMNVIVIPTNKPVIRDDMEDSVYANQKAKFKAIVNEIVERHETGQPILVGTISVEKSEMLSEMLRKRGVPHNVLNAKQHMREAEIVAQAGRFGAVTIATNMAGRGTDIILGGKFDDPLTEINEAEEELVSGGANVRKFLEEKYADKISQLEKEHKAEHDKVVAAGGLHIIGTERHEARRIDNQLRGRAGRQGDPGSSQFFVALDDDLMRLFGGERIQMVMDRFGLTDEPLEAGMLSKTIENAQKKVEGKNYGIRKYVLQYDDVMNRQRTIIYEERNRVLHGENLRDHIVSMIRDVALDDNDYEDLLRQYEAKEKEIGEERMREIERVLLLRIVDTKWMDHIDAMDQLKTGIGLRSLGQQDPARAYANEGFEMFEEMLNSIREGMVKYVLSITLETNAERKQVIRIGSASKEESGSSLDEGKPRRVSNMPKAAPTETKQARQTPIRVEKKPGRNDPCPCGSGKKYKNCHGRNE